MLHVKIPYGVDPSGAGFFCPQMEQKRDDYFSLKQVKPAVAEAVYQCRPGAKIGSIFVEADFRYFDAPIGLELGVRSDFIREWIESRGMLIAQGWDTAMSASVTSDWSVCATIGMVPCSQFHREKDAIILKECHAHYDVYVLSVYRARLDIGDLANAVQEQALIWNPQKIVIEKKASGTSVIQALVNSGLPIEGVPAEENKLQRAINGGSAAGSTQGWFRSGRILFPCITALPDNGLRFFEWLPPFIRELKDFTGEKGGVDDQVDAMVHVTNYAIREGTSGVQFPTGWRTPEEANKQMMKSTASDMIQMGGMFALAALDPKTMEESGLLFDAGNDTCSKCVNYKRGERPSCKLLKINVPALSPACPAFSDGSSETSFPGF